MASEVLHTSLVQDPLDAQIFVRLWLDENSELNVMAVTTGIRGTVFLVILKEVLQYLLNGLVHWALQFGREKLKLHLRLRFCPNHNAFQSLIPVIVRSIANLL